MCGAHLDLDEGGRAPKASKAAWEAPQEAPGRKSSAVYAVVVAGEW